MNLEHLLCFTKITGSQSTELRPCYFTTSIKLQDALSPRSLNCHYRLQIPGLRHWVLERTSHKGSTLHSVEDHFTIIIRLISFRSHVQLLKNLPGSTVFRF